MKKENQKFMEAALELAKKAYSIGEVPVGAVIVRDNKILGRAYNKKEKNGIATHHAEILAIEKASKKIKDWRLNGSIIYVTLEPCKMCMAAIEEARIEKVIYGASDSKTNVANSKQIKFMIDDMNLNIQAKDLLKKFFKNKRK
jgi:tRNA(adenine34) deaminase